MGRRRYFHRSDGSGLAPELEGWRILYSTTSHSGQIEVASGTVVVSKSFIDRSTSTPEASKLPVLAISHGSTPATNLYDLALNIKDEAFDPAGPIAQMLQSNSVSPQTSGLITAPVLVAQGLSDSLVVPNMQQDWVDATCAAGQPLEYRTFAGLNHMPLVEAGSPLTQELVDWSQDRLAGLPETNTCN